MAVDGLAGSNRDQDGNPVAPRRNLLRIRPAGGVSSVEVCVGPGERLMDIIDENALPVTFGCRSGNCGTCRVTVEAGAESLEPAESTERALLRSQPGDQLRLACRIRTRASAGADEDRQPVNPRARRPIIAVIGSRQATAEMLRVAEELGAAIVACGYRLVTGGLGGVMEAASRGARLAGAGDGSVIGLLPGTHVDAANPFVDVVIPTGLGLARNVLVVQTAAAVVVVGGGAGTLSELALAWQLGRPVVALDVGGVSSAFAGCRVDDERDTVVMRASTPEEAMAAVQSALAQSTVP